MYLLGTTLIIAGLASALLATAGYALAPRGNLAALTFGRVGVRMTLVAVLAIVALLNYLFIAQRYDIEYVYNYTERALDPAFRVAAVWAGQPGSFVIWALWGVIAAQFLVRRTRHSEPYVLTIFYGDPGGAPALYADPQPVRASDAEWRGGDAAGRQRTQPDAPEHVDAHPPAGVVCRFALMAVPFAFAIGGLWRRDYDAGCMTPCRGRLQPGCSSVSRCCSAATGHMRRWGGAVTGDGTRLRIRRWCPG